MLGEAIGALVDSLVKAAQGSDEAKAEEAKRLLGELKAKLAAVPDFTAELDADLAERLKRG